MVERGVDVDHTTLFRWVQQYAPEIEKRLRWYYKSCLGESWKVDETYVKVKGRWKYLYRAITKSGRTLGFYLSSTRNGKAAKRFLAKILRRMNSLDPPFTHQVAPQRKLNMLMKTTVLRNYSYFRKLLTNLHAPAKLES